MANKINSYFDKVYCINLDHRMDRWEQSQKEFSHHNINVNRFSAIDGETVGAFGRLSKGEHGALLSHLGVMIDAKLNNYERVLILEDDVEFEKDFENKFFSWLNEIKEWDIIYFGGYHSLNNPYNSYPLYKRSEHFYRTVHSVSAHCYALNRKVYDQLIEEMSKKTNPLDEHHTVIQKKSTCYVVRPHLAWQRPSFSNISEKYADYDFLRR